MHMYLSIVAIFPSLLPFLTILLVYKIGATSVCKWTRLAQGVALSPTRNDQAQSIWQGWANRGDDDDDAAVPRQQ